jgi:NRPS condensation-like uncharacterized protein
MSTRRVKFPIPDELATYLDSPAEPNNIFMELWLPGHLDENRLRAAVASVLASQPRARARRAARGWWRSGSEWEFPDRLDVDPLRVSRWRTEAELDAARDRFLAVAPPLHQSPPFRLLLATGPSRDSLILSTHHAAFDGRSMLRLLQLIAGRYTSHGQVQDQRPTAATSTAASAKAPADDSDPAGLARAEGRPARIAAWRWTGARHSARAGRAPGCGCVLLAWPDVPRPDGGTVNDLLIAALIRTVAQWNAAHWNVAQRKAASRQQGQIRVTMPVDTRQPGQEGDLGNFSRVRTIIAPDPLTVPGIAAQTALAKSRGPREHGPEDSGTGPEALTRLPLPVPVKRRTLRLALRLLGPRWCDTTMLTNLGRVTEPPSFGPLTPERMWLSPSVYMPRGLSVGAISVAGRLQLCIRYRYALLDDAAAAEFAARYADALRAMAGHEVAGR